MSSVILSEMKKAKRHQNCIFLCQIGLQRLILTPHAYIDCINILILAFQPHELCKEIHDFFNGMFVCLFVCFLGQVLFIAINT